MRTWSPQGRRSRQRLLRRALVGGQLEAPIMRIVGVVVIVLVVLFFLGYFGRGRIRG